MDNLLSEAINIQKEAEVRGLTLKLLGGLAIQANCPSWPKLAEGMGRRASEDIDFIGHSRHKTQMLEWFQMIGFELDHAVRHSQEFGINRFILVGPGKPKIDIFFDQLQMAHTIDLSGRLAHDGVTLSSIDLLLTKLQIHEFTKNDSIDTIILLLDHNPIEDDSQRALFATLMSKDWGFHRSVKINLDFLADCDAVDFLEQAQRKVFLSRVDQLRCAMEELPRSLNWKLRSKIGTRVLWYQQVEEA